MLRIVTEMSLADFTPWSGAIYTYAVLERLDLLDELESLMEEIDDEWDETAINDFLWFEDDYIAELLGYADWEALEASEDDEEEEDEEEDYTNLEIGFDPYMGCYSDDC